MVGLRFQLLARMEVDTGFKKTTSHEEPAPEESGGRNAKCEDRDLVLSAATKGQTQVTAAGN